MSQQDIAELRDRISKVEADIGKLEAKLEASAKSRHVYNLHQAAERENMSIPKFRAEVKAGLVSGKKIGRIWHFTNADLAAYEAQRSTDE